MTTIAERLSVFGAMRDEPLARHTTLHIGGPADWFAVARDAGQLVALLRAATELGLPATIVAGGSNMLVADNGVRGLVIDNRAAAVTLAAPDADGQVLITAESGTPMATLARRVSREGLAGLEWAIGIPGTIGGCVLFNAGAHGSDMAASLVDVELLTPGGELTTIAASDLALGYRRSAFTVARQAGQPLGSVIRARLRLEPGDPLAIESRMTHYNEHRRTTQPARASAGSIFKNPPADSAGRLVEAAGLKGARRGACEISTLHANFIVNHGGGMAADVRALIALAQQRVFHQFGVELEPEVQFIGDWAAAGVTA